MRSERNKFKVVARAEIEGPEWSFRRGQLLEAMEEDGGTFKVWALGQDDSYLSGVPRDLLKPTKR